MHPLRQVLTPRRLGVGALAIVAGIVLTGGGSASFAAGACTKVAGTYRLTAITGASCTSPVSFCAALDYDGAINAGGTFIASALTPSADTPTSAVIWVTGDTVIDDGSGSTLILKTAFSLDTSGKQQFAGIEKVIGGSGRATGASGILRTVGRYSGGEAGEAGYRGRICLPGS